MREVRHQQIVVCLKDVERRLDVLRIDKLSLPDVHGRRKYAHPALMGDQVLIDVGGVELLWRAAGHVRPGSAGGNVEEQCGVTAHQYHVQQESGLAPCLGKGYGQRAGERRDPRTTA